MEEIKRVIFAAGSGTSRAPMAAAIMKQMTEGKDIDVLARGVVVLFPEPMNQKTEAVLISNGIAPDNFAAEQLTAADIVPGTLILTMDEAQRVKVIEEIEGAERIIPLSYRLMWEMRSRSSILMGHPYRPMAYALKC